MPSVARSTWALLGFGAMAVASGALIALQSHLNGTFGTEIHNGVLAASISFMSGMLVLAAAAMATRAGRDSVRGLVATVRSRDYPWWYFSGGVCGAFLVVTQGVSAVPLGVALYTVGLVAGQLVSGMLIDRRGLGTLPPVNPTRTRVAGATLAVAAVGVAVAGDMGGGSSWWLLALPFLAGAGSAFQQAVNGQVRHLTGSAMTATFGNFFVGMLALVVAAGVAAGVRGLPSSLPDTWWLYAGGLIGIGFIAINAAVVSHLGVLLLTMCSVAGQIMASLVIDIVAGRGLHVTTVVGALLTLAAVGIASTPSRPVGSAR